MFNTVSIYIFISVDFKVNSFLTPCQQFRQLFLFRLKNFLIKQHNLPILILANAQQVLPCGAGTADHSFFTDNDNLIPDQW